MRTALRSGVVSAPFLQGEVLHDAPTGRLFILNPSAAIALRGLKNGADSDGIAYAIVRQTGIDGKTAGSDLDRFIQSLKEAGLLLDTDSGPAPSDPPPRPPDRMPALAATYRLGDRRIRVACHPEDIAAAFEQVAAPVLTDDDAPCETCLTLFRQDDAFVLLENDCVIDRLSCPRAARWALVRELAGEGQGRPWLALLHASAVLTPKGCILLLGESGAGKSTLLAGLIHEGFPFVADDISFLERGTGLIWPTPMAISIKEKSWPLVGRMFPKLAEAKVVRFGDRTMRYLTPDPAAVAVEAGHPIAAALFVCYAEGAPLGLERLDAASSLVRLGRGGSILPDSDAGLGEFLERWPSIPAWQLTYGHLDEAIPRIATLTAEDGERPPRDAVVI